MFEGYAKSKNQFTGIGSGMGAIKVGEIWFITVLGLICNLLTLFNGLHSAYRELALVPISAIISDIGSRFQIPYLYKYLKLGPW
uniref:Uncharacterized protein n=1 Tax=Megaselia scalaris TaxID=36166 RepID=T1GZP7_MEGSC